MRLKCDIRCFLLVAGALSSSGGTALAQYTGPAIASPARVASAPASAMRVEYENVRIMPGDVISIATYGAPELTTTHSNLYRYHFRHGFSRSCRPESRRTWARSCCRIWARLNLPA
jgi:hypothetical protein